MTIVAYGYGLESAPTVFTDAVILALTDEPDITLDPDITITVDAEDAVITLDADIDIEVN